MEIDSDVSLRQIEAHAAVGRGVSPAVEGEDGALAARGAADVEVDVMLTHRDRRADALNGGEQVGAENEMIVPRADAKKMMNEEHKKLGPGPGRDADLRTGRDRTRAVELEPRSGVAADVTEPLEDAPDLFVVTGFKVCASDEDGGEGPGTGGVGFGGYVVSAVAAALPPLVPECLKSGE